MTFKTLVPIHICFKMSSHLFFFLRGVFSKTRWLCPAHDYFCTLVPTSHEILSCKIEMVIVL